MGVIHNVKPYETSINEAMVNALIQVKWYMTLKERLNKVEEMITSSRLHIKNYRRKDDSVIGLIRGK